jgi:tetratricopeptide (TPR) repeat protein
MALEILSTLHTADHADVADLYCDLGNVYHDQRDYGRALECHLKDLEINRRLHSAVDHSCFATTYHNIGLVYEAQRRFSLAVEMFERALAIKAAERGPDHAEAVALGLAVARAASRSRDDHTP